MMVSKRNLLFQGLLFVKFLVCIFLGSGIPNSTFNTATITSWLGVRSKGGKQPFRTIPITDPWDDCIFTYIFMVDFYLEPHFQPFINGCFNWMIPNLYIENGCFTKHPFINGCLGFQVWFSCRFSYTSSSHGNPMDGIFPKLVVFSCIRSEFFKQC